MMGIGNITINGEGKTKEEIKKEAMAEFEKQIDKMIGAKEQKEEEKVKPSKLSIVVEENAEKTGYNVETDIELNDMEYCDTMTMLTDGVAQLFKQLFEDDKSRLLAVAQFAPALLHSCMEGEEDE